MSYHESLKGSFCDTSEFQNFKPTISNTLPASNKYSEDAYMDERRLKPSEALIRKHCGVSNSNKGVNCTARKKDSKRRSFIEKLLKTMSKKKKLA